MQWNINKSAYLIKLIPHAKWYPDWLISLEICQPPPTRLLLALRYEACKGLYIATGLSIVQILQSAVYQHSIKILALFHVCIYFRWRGDCADVWDWVPKGNILSALQGNFLTTHKKGISTIVENQCDGVFSGILKTFASHLY